MVERPRPPGIEPPARNAPDAIAPTRDFDFADEEVLSARSLADTIALSPEAAGRLAEPARVRAFVLDAARRSHDAVDAGDGRSIVLEGGLYRLDPHR